MRIACLLMQKNEGPLLKSWLCYHGSLVGFENIYIIDNGSDDPLTIEILNEFQTLGVNIDRHFNQKSDFDFHGHLITNQILKIEKSQNICDFYFPLDCDEFLGAFDKAGNPRLDKQCIIDALYQLLESDGVLYVGRVFDSTPVHPDYYAEIELQRKVFIFSGKCMALANGYHSVDRADIPEIKTNITYIHFHFRRYDDYVKFSKEKLAPYLAQTGSKALEEYKGPGWHVASQLMKTRRQYYAQFKKHGRVYLPHILKTIRALEAKVTGRNQGAMSSIDTMFATPEEAADAMASPTGCVDLVEKVDAFLRVAGWAAMPDGSAVRRLTFYVNNQPVPVHFQAQVLREDVVRARQAKDKMCGFDCRLLIEDMPEDSDSLTVFAVNENNEYEIELGAPVSGPQNWMSPGQTGEQVI